jgi:hypothetical protein
MTAQSAGPVTPQEQRDLVMRQVNDLRDFEHEYRTRLRQLHQGQLRKLDEEDDPRQRSAELADLASLDIARYASRGLVAAGLRAWAHESLQGVALDKAWARYKDAVELEQNVDDGTVRWHAIEPALVSVGDPQETAREITRAHSAAALDVLVRGAR